MRPTKQINATIKHTNTPYIEHSRDIDMYLFKSNYLVYYSIFHIMRTIYESIEYFQEKSDISATLKNSLFLKLEGMPPKKL